MYQMITGCMSFNGRSDSCPTMPSLELMMDLRASPEAYSFFCYFFLPEVVGKRAFFRSVQTGGKLSTIAMESDEAFGLATLLNANKRWTWEFYHPPGSCDENDVDEKPRAIYSVGSKGNAKKYEGWSIEGTNKFNELIIKIAEDRKIHPEYDEYFAKKMYVYSHGRYGKKRRKLN